ncbi:MAG: Gfo/Idh/MocA family oxidoreductase [Saprospiraceae bacterium]
MGKIKIGVFGAGYFGNFHINNLLKTKFELVGFYDINKQRSDFIEKTYKIKSFTTPIELLSHVDAIDITTPTSFHFDLIKSALVLGKHVFVEKPMTSNSKEAEEILNLLDKNHLKLQIGHIERYNPVIRQLELNYLKANPIINIEMIRYSKYNPRGTDVPVVFDLMIHDIDLLHYLKSDEIGNIQASGIKKFGNNIEFAEANIYYKNGSMASLKSSIIHPYNERKIKIWTQSDFFEIDLNNKIYEKYNYLKEIDKNMEIINDKESKTFVNNNAILDELIEFYNSIEQDIPTSVNAYDGYKAIKLAEEILGEIKN